MTRPPVSVVMPFAGTTAEARRALSMLLALERRDGDELIVADNSSSVPPTPGVAVISARGERSPAHARNAGAARAGDEWILFLDADCRPLPGLLDAYFAPPVDAGVGALAGGVVPAPDARTLAARYGSARSFLNHEAHLAHPYRPRAAAANLLVRRAAFEELGGFYEGLRAAEDTDFCWRLQEAGWRLDTRPVARVEHRYRESLSELRRQWRSYAAGRAWLARRYRGFTPEPAVARAARRAARRAWARAGGRTGGGGAGAGGGVHGGAALPGAPAGRSARAGPRAYLALDALLALDELAGFALSNRPSPRAAPPPARLVLVADRFPVPGVAAALAEARVEAAHRPEVIDPRAAGDVHVDYREDDGIGARALALAWVVLRHPARVAHDVLHRRKARGPNLGGKRGFMGRFPPSSSSGPGLPLARSRAPSLAALAPAALRLARDPQARVVATNGEAAATARRLAALARTPPEDAP